MIKKILSSALIPVLFAVFMLPASGKGNGVSVKSLSESELSVSWSVDSGEAQQLLSEVKKRLTTIYTQEEISSLPDGIFDRNIVNFIVFSSGPYSAVFALEGDNGEQRFSLYGDIIPAFDAAADFSRGGEITVSVIPATENYPAENSLSFPSLSSKAENTVQVLPSGRIIYIQPDGTVNGNPAAFKLPLETDIPLNNPTLTGNTFTGWVSENIPVDRVKAGAQNVTVRATFEPRVYKINYNFTTDINYSFGRVNNTVNPKTYTYGEETPLYNVKSPVGGYTFGGWYYNGEKIDCIPAGMTGDVIICAKWLTMSEAEDEKNKALVSSLENAHYCDPDGDGKITVSDARLTLRAAIGLEQFTPETVSRIDFFGTQKAGIENARTVLRIAIGLDDKLTVYLNSPAATGLN